MFAFTFIKKMISYYDIVLYCTGVHPDHYLGTFRVITNLSVTVCGTILVLMNIYKETKLEGVESLSLLLIVLIKYLTLVFGRRLLKKITYARENFWEVNITDEGIEFFKQHLDRVDKFHKFLSFTGMVAYAAKPLTQNNKSSILGCYVPPAIPYPVFFIFELYFFGFVSSTFISFNILICSLIISVVIQFRLLNSKIRTINFLRIETKHDMDICFRKLKHTIKYHQFLIRYVQDLNKLLSTPVAILIVFSVSLMCLNMYNLSVNKSSIVNSYKVMITVSSVIAEFFSVYGFPAQLMMDGSAATGDTIYYECNWYLPKVRPLRKDFLMIIMRSQKNVGIRAADYHVSSQTILQVITKYLTLIFGRRLVQQILKATENFRPTDITDDQTNFFKKHLDRVQNFHLFVMYTGMLTFAVKPFVLTDASSMFGCYVPPQIPYPLFYIFELYLLSFLSLGFVSFNVMICTLIMSVVTQFRFLNYKIKAINFSVIENDHDLETCINKLKHRVRYHQFLIGYVQELNKLLSTPVALMMIFSVSLMCMDMYILSVHKGTIVDHCKVILTSSAVISEFFSVYGLPAQLMMDESAATADTIYYECDWYLPKVRPLQKDFLMVIMRSQKNVSIRACNYHVVSNQTILMMMKTAYSFYTVLQTMT